MNHLRTEISNSNPTRRTAVHAGPLLLENANGPTALKRYLARNDQRKFFLIHSGRPLLRRVADEAGVQAIAMDPTEDEPEAERAAQMAVSMCVDDLELTIDRPALTTLSGTPIEKITASEAERYAAEPGLRKRIRNKVLAACHALRGGVTRVRIGNPTALGRGSATVIVPDGPSALGRSSHPEEPMDTDDEARSPVRDPGVHPIELPSPPNPQPVPALALPRMRTRRLRFSPRRGCEIGPRMDDPFPLHPADRPDSPGRNGRRYRRTPRAA